jgi:hypothetical protein
VLAVKVLQLKLSAAQTVNAPAEEAKLLPRKAPLGRAAIFGGEKEYYLEDSLGSGRSFFKG